MLDVRLAATIFDPAVELAHFRQAHGAAGGLVSFLGQVRGGADFEALELQHYAPMTLPAMQGLAGQIMARWPLEGLLLLHRFGVMLAGEPIVLVVAASRHRRDGFAAADYAMDHLKSESWFWKREKRAGEWTWIEPRAQDYTDQARWAE